EQMIVGASSLPVLPLTPIFFQVIHRRRIWITVVEVPDLISFTRRRREVFCDFAHVDSVPMLGWLARGLILLLAPLLVLALGAGGATRALRYSHPVLRLGFAPVAGLSRGHSVRVLVGDSRIARIRIDCRGGVSVPAHRLTSQVGDAILRQ